MIAAIGSAIFVRDSPNRGNTSISGYLRSLNDRYERNEIHMLTKLECRSWFYSTWSLRIMILSLFSQKLCMHSGS